ncbi:MAG: 7-cyano-7-deazaguanine synthase QueC [Ectothiorhodospiraceae bacterium]|nr:7-cyano-7-deazaguanine synthase QueC [Ectothiorhodospiraceae bacterium]
MSTKKNAVVLLSGGLDSATTLVMAKAEGYSCYALSFDYGQRHRAELHAAAKLANKLGVVEYRVAPLDLRAIGGSALTDESIDVPTASTIIPSSGDSMEDGVGQGETSIIPVTYVPARNTIFLSYALAWAEVLEAEHIFIGVNAVDYSGYPDCRPEYIKAFQTMASLATKAGVEGHPTHIHTPLIQLSKADIIRKGLSLGLGYGDTISCYDADDQGRACGQCDSCHLRAAGFAEAGVNDPTLYR